MSGDAWWDSFMAFLGFAASGYFFVVLLAYVFQKKMIFFPDGVWERTPDQLGMSFEDLVLITADGIPVSAWWLPASDARATLLFCHGNAGNISHRLDAVKILQGLSLNVLLFDYRGYGKSGGTPSEKGLYLDAETAWQYLVQKRGLAADQILILGKSLGGPVAAHLAARNRPGGLILQSTFTSMVNLGVRLYPYLPVRILARFRFPTDVFLSRVKCPVLVIHSHDDEIIPVSFGRELLDAAREPKRMLEIRGGHNDGMFVSVEQYSTAVNTFLDDCRTG